VRLGRQSPHGCAAAATGDPPPLIYTPRVRDDINNARRWLTRPDAGPAAWTKLDATLGAIEGVGDPPSRWPLGRTMQADQRTLRSDFNVFRREVKAGLDTLDARVGAIGDRVAGIEARIDTRFDQIQSDIARSFDTRFDQMQAAITQSLDRLIETLQARPG